MKLQLSPGLLLGAFLIFVGCSYRGPQENPEAKGSSYLSDSLFEELETSIDNKLKFDCDLFNENPPGDTPKIFAYGKVSTGKENGAITFSPNGKELWFARVYPPQIFYMENKDGAWTAPTLAPFSGKYKDLYPSLSPDGKKLFFASNRPVKMDAKSEENNLIQIWECRKMQSGWTEPRNLGAIINFGMYQICPSISAKGTLYYNLVTNTKDSSYLDIYESKYIYNTFAKPHSLGISINSASLDYSPFIAKDESFIIFASRRHGYGSGDLFISYKKSDGEWTEAINMGPNINTRFNEDFPSISPDGKYLFFNSNRTANCTSEDKPKMFSYIYWVKADIIEKLKPNYLKKIQNEKGKRL
ncbi:MAG: hypothetical protein HC831_09395 [Chloroflexia bacterium]|nr:hypothetical protein [Chloroflexia bacterium]